MQLKYRGVDYDYLPPPLLKAGPACAFGSYRGVATEFHPIANLPEILGYDLTWRGVPYHSGSAASVVVDGAIAPTPLPETVPVGMSIADRARNLVIRRHQRMRRREQGMLVRLAEEVGMPLDEAAHYESQIQGKIPHDFGGYDDSHRAMS